jgi:hypothetical protein
MDAFGLSDGAEPCERKRRAKAVEEIAYADDDGVELPLGSRRAL